MYLTVLITCWEVKLTEQIKSIGKVEDSGSHTYKYGNDINSYQNFRLQADPQETGLSKSMIYLQ